MNIIRKIRTGYRHTIYACYIGYITQAAVNSFAPLLFVIFQDSLGLSLRQITSLVTVNFCVQITVDLLAGKYADRIGYRKLAVAAHLFCVIGLTGFAWIPFALPSPFAGLLLCIVLNAIGGGIDEVLISPIVEACPDGKNKESAMGLLHSFYCWGVVGVVVITTLFLRVFGKENWRIICLLWGIVPLIDVFAFSLVPIESLTEDGESMRVRSLLGNSTFWILMVLMIAAGASEQAMSQWASAFAERGLRISKLEGDLLGPCMFSVLMGTSRVIYAKAAPKIDSVKAIIGCGILCVFSYLLAVFAPFPLLSLSGCALCGLSVGIFWPGFFSQAAVKLPRGGTVMFALLAFAGDIGCSGGPTLVGQIAGSFSDNLKTGLLAAVVFPLILILCSILLRRKKNPAATVGGGSDEQ